MGRIACVFLLVVGPVLAVCARCGDKGEVKCPVCDGKKAPALACADCENGGMDCLACQGVGTNECIACKGTGKVDSGLKCRFCQKGRTKCRLCQGGRVKCTTCKAAGAVKTRCPLCVGVGKFPCPDCGGPGKAEACGVCSGSTRETCPACEGEGQVVRGCAGCQGLGKARCTTCAGQGRTPCSSCRGSGRQPKRNKDGSIEGSTECEPCDDTGSKPCPECEQKGTKRCGPCEGTGRAKTACAFCQGWKAIDCRACATAAGWTGEDPACGGRFTLVPCETFEPTVVRGLSTTLGIEGVAVLRLFVENPDVKLPARLGADGWAPVWTGADGELHAAANPQTVIGPQAYPRLERLLPAWGAGARDLVLGAQAPPQGVASLLVIVNEDVSKTAERVRLSGPGGNVDLVAAPVPRETWVRLRLAGASK